ncbi:hypothetical protein Trydic_g22803 [Trypoxylus dichotomus]
MEEANTQVKSESLCKVCGDKASGKHYGVASCDGCRGFFKRSIRRNLEYVCKENGRCIVDVTRRNQCQACRFRKCLQVNMKRDAVQHERAPRSAQTNLHHYPLGISTRYRDLHPTPFLPGLPLHLQNSTVLESGTLTHSAIQNPYLQHGLLYPNVFNSFGKPIFTGTNTLSFQQKSANPILIPNISKIIMKEDEVSSSEESNSSSRLKDESNTHKEIFSQTTKPLDLPSLSERKPLHVPCLSLFPAENIYESAAKLLFLAIKWARTIPSFLQLSYRDQSILLEESWSELFVLTAAQWALSVDEALLVSNAMAPTARHSALEENARKLREIISRLTLLRVDHTEHACLKALVLFKAECRGLCEPTHVELLQDQTHVMLHEYCSQSKSTHKGRFGKLLLTLPAVQAVSRQGLEELLFRQTVGDVSIDRLLGDLAKTSNGRTWKIWTLQKVNVVETVAHVQIANVTAAAIHQKASIAAVEVAEVARVITVVAKDQAKVNAAVEKLAVVKENVIAITAAAEPVAANAAIVPAQIAVARKQIVAVAVEKHVTAKKDAHALTVVAHHH